MIYVDLETKLVSGVRKTPQQVEIRSRGEGDDDADNNGDGDGNNGTSHNAVSLITQAILRPHFYRLRKNCIFYCRTDKTMPRDAFCICQVEAKPYFSSNIMDYLQEVLLRMKTQLRRDVETISDDAFQAFLLQFNVETPMERLPVTSRYTQPIVLPVEEALITSFREAFIMVHERTPVDQILPLCRNLRFLNVGAVDARNTRTLFDAFHSHSHLQSLAVMYVENGVDVVFDSLGVPQNSGNDVLDSVGDLLAACPLRMLALMSEFDPTILFGASRDAKCANFARLANGIRLNDTLKMLSISDFVCDAQSRIAFVTAVAGSKTLVRFGADFDSDVPTRAAVLWNLRILSQVLETTSITQIVIPNQVYDVESDYFGPVFLKALARNASVLNCITGADVDDDSIVLIAQRNREQLCWPSINRYVLELYIALAHVETAVGVIPPYVFLEIFDWLPCVRDIPGVDWVPIMHRLQLAKKMQIIGGVAKSVRRALCAREEEQSRKRNK